VLQTNLTAFGSTPATGNDHDLSTRDRDAYGEDGMTWQISAATEGDVLWHSAHALGSSLDQVGWLAFRAEWHISNHLLVAAAGAEAIGFLRFVVQLIGPDMDGPPVVMDGVPLTEAKILAFGVADEWRRQGIGRALQEAAVQQAKTLGCYQVRSHSGGDHDTNHHLKLAMGFAIHPIIRGDDRNGCYFLLPLRAAAI
jgi:GNAT superfamily N-acetyltransferase